MCESRYQEAKGRKVNLKTINHLIIEIFRGKKLLIALEENKPTSQHLCGTPEEILATTMHARL